LHFSGSRFATKIQVSLPSALSMESSCAMRSPDLSTQFCGARHSAHSEAKAFQNVTNF